MPGTELEDRKPRLSLNRSFFRVLLRKTFAIHIRDITCGIIFSLLFENLLYPSATDKKDYFLEQAGETNTLTGISADTAFPCFFCNPPHLTQGRSLCSLTRSSLELGALNSRLTATTIARVFPRGREALGRLTETQRDPIEAGDGSEVFLEL